MRARPDKQRIIEALLDAYRAGDFPMADPDSGAIGLYTAPQRGVIPLELGAFHVPRRLTQRLNSAPFVIACDTRFAEVVRACALPRSEDNGVWISEDLAALYVLLHEAGHAHSVEAFIPHPMTGEPELVGGVFGVHIGAAFLGESMFHAPPPGGTDASKACLVHLVAHLRQRGFTLFDTQLTNPFLERFGCVAIPRRQYESRLAQAVALDIPWAPFGPDWRRAL
ncbi:MAG: leucyl/phenylalanyl-tRNA--protein transferase [Phycisphaeraceae bacterium]|nr:leucyl/phenylalanyl-tRNA--protein transferase [Phycisphaeraceae bacterium]MCB9847369.1 leucyl/phenylalanyl-tRNA--protein transferase [Phycisphaeraceae bacterium]